MAIVQRACNPRRMPL